MRVYGTIFTNLKKLAEKAKIDIIYSIDYLVFESPEGEEFYIDLEEGDFAKEAGYIWFRLKSLGITYMDQWDNLNRDKNIDIEQDYAFFRKCKLKEIGVYLDPTRGEDIESLQTKLKCKPYELQLNINGGTIHYRTNKVKIEIS